MKRTFYLGFALVAAAALQSCSSSKSAFRDVKDDVYYVQSDDKYYKGESAPEEVSKGSFSDERSDYDSKQNPNSESEYRKDSRILEDKGGDTYINNNYYNDNSGYNDFYYTSRIRRFYHPSATFGYHNPYYYYGYRYRPGWNIGFSYGYPSWYDPFYSPYSCYDPFWGPTWSNYYYDPYFYPYYYSPYYSPYYSYNKGYYDGYYSNWNNWGGNNWGGNNWGGSGSGSGSGGGINTYYGPRNMQGSHNILNTGMRNAPPRVRKEEEPIKIENKPQDIQKDQPRGVATDDKPVLQPGNEAGENPKTTVVPESRETVPTDDDNQNPNTEWKTRYNTPINERPKFDKPAGTGDIDSKPQQDQPQQPRFDQPKEPESKPEPRYQQPRYQEPKEQPRYEQPKYEQPRHEQPKYEQPKQQPRYEQPKNEQPRYEQPRQNSQPKWENNNNAPRINGSGTSSPGNNNNNNNSGRRFQGR